MRVNGGWASAQSRKPCAVAFTRIEPKLGSGDSSKRKFVLLSRKTCLLECFSSDRAAMARAESCSEELIEKWLCWLQAQTHELPVVIRFDFLVKHVGPGAVKVTTCELTELGGCLMGWEDGLETIFNAMIRSCMEEECTAETRGRECTGDDHPPSAAGKRQISESDEFNMEFTGSRH